MIAASYDQILIAFLADDFDVFSIPAPAPVPCLRTLEATALEVRDVLEARAARAKARADRAARLAAGTARPGKLEA